MSTAWRMIPILLLMLPFAGGAAHGATPCSPGEARVCQAEEGGGGEIVGRIIDSSTGEPIANARIRLREVGRNDLSQADGSYRFGDLAPRSYTILSQRIGFAPAEARVELGLDESREVIILMVPSALELSGVVVTGTGRERLAGESYRPTTVIGEAELRRRLDASVAATVARAPGIAQQYNGPAASQPVIRGMGGDRVLVLEDGQRTGDLSTTGGDHAVGIEPLTAQRIEMVRGPAGLLYGSNALGGVINVVREEVPRTLPERSVGMMSAQMESVNGSISSGAALTLPFGSNAVRAEVSGRRAGETRTPLGLLPSTEVRSLGAALGASRIADWGFLGASVREYRLDYGVPGEFAGTVIPGAHPHGVEIETQRRAGRIEGAHRLGFGPVSSLAFDVGLVHYQHREIEGRAGERSIIGARFDNLAGNANLIVRHEHGRDPLFSEGAFGFSFGGRDLRTGGSFTGTRDASSYSLAGFVYEELRSDPARLQLGARYDWVRITPHDRRPIETEQRSIPVRDRTFATLSASIAGLIEPLPGITFGASLARSFRPPSIEELYSDGPHLADYSYDIGNPELGREIGYGGDLFIRIARARVSAEANLFRNQLTDYIYHAPTAELDPRFRRFPLFEARGASALFEGAEGALQWEVLRNWVIDGSLSYVRASLRETGEPLPSIPPLNSSFELRYQRPSFFIAAEWQSARRQDRVPYSFHSPESGERISPQQPSPGYDLIHLGTGIRWARAERLHTISVQIENVMDAVWRDHLSRIKEVAPQPGRNLQLLYRLYF